MRLEAVAEQIGMPVEDLALWEQDSVPPEQDAGTLHGLCELFGVSTAFLLGLDDPPEAVA